MTTHRAGIMLLIAGFGLTGAACGGSGETGSSSSGSGGSGGAPSGSSATGSSSASTGSSVASSSGAGGGSSAGAKLFLILMENHNWKDIKGSASAPYINGTLLTQGAHAEQYFNPKNIHPSEPNYIWLEAGDNFGIANDLGPLINRQATTDHLVAYLEKAGLTWKSYQEDIDG